MIGHCGPSCKNRDYISVIMSKAQDKTHNYTPHNGSNAFIWP